MYKLVKKRKWERIEKRLQVQERMLAYNRGKIKGLEARCRMLEMENWKSNSRIMGLQRKNERMERKIKEELWEKVHDILVAKERRKDSCKEFCGCYHNVNNGKWEVVTGGCFSYGEEAERVLFSTQEDARCYYELMQVFGMQPAARESMERYMESLRKTA